MIFEDDKFICCLIVWSIWYRCLNVHYLPGLPYIPIETMNQTISIFYVSVAYEHIDNKHIELNFDYVIIELLHRMRTFNHMNIYI